MLFLVHHADAVDAAVDPQRPLSPSGQRHAEQLARRAQEHGFKPAVIWHSGKLRARQTGEFFWRACNPLAEFAAARGLQPDDPPEWIRDVVVADARDIMLVGHMPHMARLLTLFVTRQHELHPPFPAHGLVALNRGADRWDEIERLM
jgi:phosphohistidine phosphatase